MINRASILVYHAVHPFPASARPAEMVLGSDDFARQMAFLAQHRRVVTLDDLLGEAPEMTQQCVAITFDDGYRSVYEHALPILEKFDLPATMFVPTGAMGGHNTWDHVSPPAGLPVMSSAELLELEARGMSVESHGHGHIDLANTDLSSVRQDLRTSIEILTELLGRPPRFLAYPWGRVTPAVEELVDSLGFVSAFTVGSRGRGPFARARIPVRSVTPPWKFQLQTSGYWPALRYSRAGSPLRAAVRAAKTWRDS